MSSTMGLTLAFSAGVGVFASMIWSHKGGGWARGFWFGAVLGLVGLLFVAASTPRRSTRPAIGILLAFTVIEVLSLGLALRSWFITGTYEAWVMVVVTSGCMLAYAALAIVVLQPLVTDAWGPGRER